MNHTDMDVTAKRVRRASDEPLSDERTAGVKTAPGLPEVAWLKLCGHGWFEYGVVPLRGFGWPHVSDWTGMRGD